MKVQETSQDKQQVIAMEQGGVVVIERVRVKAATVIIALTILTNLIVAIWTAASYKASLDQVKMVVSEELVPAIHEVREVVQAQGRRLDLIEERERLREQYMRAQKP